MCEACSNFQHFVHLYFPHFDPIFIEGLGPKQQHIVIVFGRGHFGREIAYRAVELAHSIHQDKAILAMREEIKKLNKKIPLYEPPKTVKEINDQRSYEMRKNGWNNPRSTWTKGTPTHRKKIKIRRREKDW